MQAKVDMLQGHEGKVVQKLFWPMIAGALGIVAFNLVDTYFVGKLGTDQLAAMGFAFPVALTSASLALGLGIGTSSLVAQMMGAGDKWKARRITTDAHLFAVLFSIALAVVGLLTIGPLFAGLGASPDILPYIRAYMTIWYMGFPFVVIPMIGQNVLRAQGDTKLPSIFLMVAVSINIALDPLLIFGYGPFPELGIAGAAYATVIARGSLIIGTLVILWYRDGMFATDLGGVNSIISSWGKILYIGIPATIMNIVIPITQGFLTKLVSGYGSAEVAAIGVASRLESFAMVFMMTISMIVTPFVGQNYGARKIKRAWRGFSFSSLYALLWAVLVFTVFSLFGPEIASVFNDDPTVIDVTATFLLIFSLSYGFQGIVTITTSAFNGLSKPFQAAGASLFRLLICYVPLAILGKQLYGLTGIFVGAAIGNVIAGTVAYFWFRSSLLRIRRSNRKHLSFDEAKKHPADQKQEDVVSAES